MNPASIPSPTPPTAADERAPRRWPWILGIALLFAWAAFIVSGARRDRVLAEATLPDGTILRLEQVTFGPEQKLVVQRGSHPLTGLLGVSPRPEISASVELGDVFPQCGVWLTRREPDTGEPLDLDWLSHCTAVDAQGWEHLSGFAGRCHWSKGSPTSPYKETLFRDRSPFAALPPGNYREVVVGAFLPLFRPQDGRFPLKVYNTQGEVVATFDVPYPTASPKGQDWTPVTLPATQSAGNLTVTLERLDWTPQPADASVPEKRRPTLKLQPQAAITWQGQPSDDWRFISENIMAVEDGLGNMSYMDRCRLTPHVPAWRLGLLFIRKATGRYEPHEEWVSPPIDLPPEGESRDLALTGDVQKHGVNVQKVCGPGKHQFTIVEPQCMGAIQPPLAAEGPGWKVSAVHRPGNVDWTVESERPFVVWEQSNDLPGRMDLTGRIFDGNGEQIGVEEVYDAVYGDHTTITIPESAPETSAIVLKPTLNAPRSVYFFIEPPRDLIVRGETASDVQSEL